ncbi:MAG: aspartate aminotransferase family protein [Alphaproteobacteria bacterium]|nr:aspartate aminotransferase family protein [Alphaproteobacteria bacterium]
MYSALAPTYARAPIAFERGEGAYLFDTDGRRYLDFAAGVAVVSLGHCHPHLVAALHKQAETLWHTSNLYRISGQERLATRLVESSFADQVFFCNSGAEAVECGLKMVRRYQDQVGRPHRYRVITFQGAFHGRTLATLAAGGQEKHLAGYDPRVDGFDQVPYGDVDAVRRAIGDETAAILVEAVQGEAGARVPPPGFLRALRKLCDEHGLLLFLDEVQTGIGRTGRLFAYEWEGIRPDIMAIAKGLGGGFPIGACLAIEPVSAVMTAGSHGSTFGGNPLAVAVANAVLDVVLGDGFLEGVRRVAVALSQRLAPLAAEFPSIIEEMRGTGLLLGLRAKGAASAQAALIEGLRNHGLLVAPAGDNVVRLVPPLIIDDSHIEEATGILERVCRKLVS